MIIHLCCHRQKTSEKRTRGVFTAFCFSDSVFHEKTSESKDFWCFSIIIQGHETGLSSCILYLLIFPARHTLWGCKRVGNDFLSNLTAFNIFFLNFHFFLFVAEPKKTLSNYFPFFHVTCKHIPVIRTFKTQTCVFDCFLANVLDGCPGLPLTLVKQLFVCAFLRAFFYLFRKNDLFRTQQRA